MEGIIREIQEGNFSHFNVLLERFEPLILSWLKKNYKLGTTEQEDFCSMAKIILLESVQRYDFSKEVPFSSFYKMNLYHWYGNQIQKRKIDVIHAEVEESHEKDYCEKLYCKEQLKIIEENFYLLSKKEKRLYLYLAKEMSTEEISHAMEISKKTVLNKKYKLYKKLKVILLEKENKKTKTDPLSEYVKTVFL